MRISTPALTSTSLPIPACLDAHSSKVSPKQLLFASTPYLFAMASSYSSILSQDSPLFIAYVSLITLALIPIYYGAFQSLRTPKSVVDARKAARKGKSIEGVDGEDEESDEDEDEPSAVEKLTSSDAWLFPIIGSFVLFSMYLAFKFLDRIWVDRILGVYFAVVGFGAVFKVFVSLASGIVGYQKWNRLANYSLQIQKRLSDKELREEQKERKKDGKKSPRSRLRSQLSLKISAWHFPLFIAALLPVAIFHTTHHWVASNLIALSLALNAISLMGLDSFLTGSIMLGGLFFYDVFWVFGTEVMVSVARNFEAGPIKITFPKNVPQIASYYLENHSTLDNFLSALKGSPGAPKWQMTMLGLGDIVIPGIFIALALRFDQHLHLQSLKPSHLARFTRRDVSFDKPYFRATLTAYIIGLITTMAVMHVFKAAQPALLYLSPACVSAVAIQSLLRGEWKKAWTWKDEDAEEEESSTKESSKKGKKSLENGSSTKQVTEGQAQVEEVKGDRIVPTTEETQTQPATPTKKKKSKQSSDKSSEDGASVGTPTKKKKSRSSSKSKDVVAEA